MRLANLIVLSVIIIFQGVACDTLNNSEKFESEKHQVVLITQLQEKHTTLHAADIEIIHVADDYLLLLNRNTELVHFDLTNGRDKVVFSIDQLPHDSMLKFVIEPLYPEVKFQPFQDNEIGMPKAIIKKPFKTSNGFSALLMFQSLVNEMPDDEEILMIAYQPLFVEFDYNYQIIRILKVEPDSLSAQAFPLIEEMGFINDSVFIVPRLVMAYESEISHPLYCIYTTEGGKLQFKTMGDSLYDYRNYDKTIGGAMMRRSFSRDGSYSDGRFIYHPVNHTKLEYFKNKDSLILGFSLVSGSEITALLTAKADANRIHLIRSRIDNEIVSEKELLYTFSNSEFAFKFIENTLYFLRMNEKEAYEIYSYKY